jgi:hypothetical protein
LASSISESKLKAYPGAVGGGAAFGGSAGFERGHTAACESMAGIASRGIQTNTDTQNDLVDATGKAYPN